MGQGQSSTDGAQESDPPLKQDYYELLGVERTATDDELKKAYRRKALELHPDRNYGNEEGATRLFAEIQAAYEVLADPQERAWYDSHRDILLRGDSATEQGQEFSYNIRITTADEVLKLMMKFNKRVEFTDAPSGFYGGLNEFFKQIAKEEDIACQWQDLEYPDYPDFGSQDDEYEDVVRPFYASWTGFATKKSYSWKDKYRLSDAPDRRIRRLMEKENQKIRDEAIQEFNDSVRSLVAFVRKRDPRVQNNQKTEAERQKILRDAAVAQAARSRAQRQKQMEQYDDASIPEWARSRATDEHEGGFSSESDQEEHQYECVACDKIFKSEAQLNAHEKSKKHIKIVKDLKRDMRKEGRDLNLSSAQPTEKFVTREDKTAELDEQLMKDETQEVDSNAPTASNSHLSSDESQHSEAEEAALFQNGGNERIVSSEADEEDENDEYASRSEVEGRLGHKEIDGASSRIEQVSLEDMPVTSEAEAGTGAPQHKIGKAKQKRAKRAEKKSTESETGRVVSEFQCMACKAEFSSKTKLFDHIKKLNHAAPLSQVKGVSSKAKRGKK